MTIAEVRKMNRKISALEQRSHAKIQILLEMISTQQRAILVHTDAINTAMQVIEGHNNIFNALAAAGIAQAKNASYKVM